jgi:hypothetical protein
MQQNIDSGIVGRLYSLLQWKYVRRTSRIENIKTRIFVTRSVAYVPGNDGSLCNL